MLLHFCVKTIIFPSYNICIDIFPYLLIIIFIPDYMVVEFLKQLFFLKSNFLAQQRSY